MTTTITRTQPRSVRNHIGLDLPYALALLAVAAAVFSRPLVSWGMPGALNFVHIPLALLAFVTTQHATRRHIRAMAKAIGFFSAVVFLSGLANEVEPARIVSALLLWLEPILIAYVVWIAVARESGSLRKTRVGGTVFAVIISAQVVTMTMQIPRQLSLSGGDQMQGTFVGSGTGAHVAPALVLVGVVLALDHVVRTSKWRWLFMMAAAFGLLLAQLANARAVSLLFVIGLVAGAGLIGHPRLGKRTLAVLVSLLVGLVIWLTLPLIAYVPSLSQQMPGWEAKVYGLQSVLTDMRQNVEYFPIGQGPGMTLSRVAMQTPGANLDPSSAIASLGIETTDFTRDVVAVRTAVPIASSSLYSPATTFVGVFGDLGVAGLAAYVGMWAPIAREAFRKSREVNSLAAPILVITAVLLGAIQIWLEEPGFVLPLALFIALVAGGTTSRHPLVLVSRPNKLGHPFIVGDPVGALESPQATAGVRGSIHAGSRGSARLW